MQQQDYTVGIKVNATPQQAFANINNVSAWWTRCFEGHSQKLNDVFTVRFGETFITMKIVESEPGSKIRWHVTDCFKHWLKDKKEWKDTEIKWEITADDSGTKIAFTHIGLVPGIECYKGCEGAWNFYIKESLFQLLTQGKGQPELK